MWHLPYIYEECKEEYWGVKTLPPAAVQPMTGGRAPIIDPMINAKIVLYFNGV